jgi:hypothetical protein
LIKKVAKKSRRFETRFETLRFLFTHRPTRAAQKTLLLRARNSSTQIVIPAAQIYFNFHHFVLIVNFQLSTAHYKLVFLSPAHDSYRSR